MFHSGENAQCARTGHPLKITSPTKLARPGNFPPASLAGPVYMSFLWLQMPSFNGNSHLRMPGLGEAGLIWLELEVVFKVGFKKYK